jgi:hypothetical protein
MCLEAREVADMIDVFLVFDGFDRQKLFSGYVVEWLVESRLREYECE